MIDRPASQIVLSALLIVHAFLPSWRGRAALFEIRTKQTIQQKFESPGYGITYQKWLNEDVRWIISDQERSEFKKLTTDKQRDDFVERFWDRRNPNPGSPENEFKEEHYRRIAYANVHFASAIPGWKTDRGRAYIVYGPPIQIDSHPGDVTREGEESFTYEVWHYSYIKGIGGDVLLRFVDTCRCGEYFMANPAARVPPGQER